jgi:hypothetical protein
LEIIAQFLFCDLIVPFFEDPRKIIGESCWLSQSSGTFTPQIRSHKKQKLHSNFTKNARPI